MRSATNGDTDEEGEPVGHLVGAHVAAGFIQALAGRLDKDSREALWIPRVRERLGAIAKRFEERPEADDYWTPATAEPGRAVVDDGGQLRVESAGDQIEDET